MRDQFRRLSALLIVIPAALFLLAGCNKYEPEENFTVKTNDNKVTITGYKGNAAELNIPPRIGGKTVTEIDTEAFLCCTSLTSVKISDGVTKIGNMAFSGGTGLRRVSVPKGADVACDAFPENTNVERY